MALHGRIGVLHQRELALLSDSKKIAEKVQRLNACLVNVQESINLLCKKLLVIEHRDTLPHFSLEEIAFLQNTSTSLSSAEALSLKDKINAFKENLAKIYNLLNEINKVEFAAHKSKSSSDKNLDSLVKLTYIFGMQSLSAVCNALMDFMYAADLKSLGLKFEDREIEAISQLAFALTALNDDYTPEQGVVVFAAPNTGRKKIEQLAALEAKKEALVAQARRLIIMASASAPPEPPASPHRYSLRFGRFSPSSGRSSPASTASTGSFFASVSPR